nr:hypothetical protein B0A51_17505 [Rachicladosporium sp. CCFEE 5018]
MGLIDNLRAKYDLYRLEQRYTRRDKRTTFISNAQYVDGEYVYNVSSPISTKSSGSFGSGFGNKNRASVLVTEVFSRDRSNKAG